jgi:hypothetical protein
MPELKKRAGLPRPRISPGIQLLMISAACCCLICSCAEKGLIEEQLMKATDLSLVCINHYYDGGSVGFAFKTSWNSELYLQALHQNENLGGKKEKQRFFIGRNDQLAGGYEIVEHSPQEKKLIALLKHHSTVGGFWDTLNFTCYGFEPVEDDIERLAISLSDRETPFHMGNIQRKRRKE